MRSVSLDDAATLLSVSRRTIYSRIRVGRLNTVRTLNGASLRVLNDDALQQETRRKYWRKEEWKS